MLGRWKRSKKYAVMSEQLSRKREIAEGNMTERNMKKNTKLLV